MVTVQLIARVAPGVSVPIVCGPEGVAVHPAGRSSVAATFWAKGPLRLATVPDTVKLSPPRAGLAALPCRPSIATSLGTAGEPHVPGFQLGARLMRAGTPPRTVPRLVSETFSSPLPAPPS